MRERYDEPALEHRWSEHRRAVGGGRARIWRERGREAVSGERRSAWGAGWGRYPKSPSYYNSSTWPRLIAYIPMYTHRTRLRDAELEGKGLEWDMLEPGAGGPATHRLH